MENQEQYKPPNEYMEEQIIPISSQRSNTNNSKIIRNQSIPNANLINNISRALKANSSYVKCPYCGHMALTRTTTQMSIVNLLCFILTLTIGWLLWQCIRGKDFSCYNVDHFCLKCDAKLADYKAC